MRERAEFEGYQRGPRIGKRRPYRKKGGSGSGTALRAWRSARRDQPAMVFATKSQFTSSFMKTSMNFGRALR